MLIIEQSALANGAHRSQRGSKVMPAGWLPVLPSIEEEALGYLPFIVIDEVERGWITKVSQGTVPEPEPEPDPQPTLSERVTALEANKAEQTDVDELNEALNMILTGYTGEEAGNETGTA